MLKVSFLSAAGGVGKTSLCFHLAHALSSIKDWRGLVVDLAHDCRLTSLCQSTDSSLRPRDSGRTILDVLFRDVPATKALTPTGYPKLFFVAGSPALSWVDVQLSYSHCEKTFVHSPLATGFADAENNFDFVLFDCPTGGSSIGLQAVLISDISLVVAANTSAPLAVSVPLAVQTLEHVRHLQTQSAVSSSPRAHIVGGNLNRKSKSGRAFLDALFETLPRDKIFEGMNYSSIVEMAEDLRSPVCAYDHRSRPARGLRQLVADILGTLSSGPPLDAPDSKFLPPITDVNYFDLIDSFFGQGVYEEVSGWSFDHIAETWPRLSLHGLDASKIVRSLRRFARAAGEEEGVSPPYTLVESLNHCEWAVRHSEMFSLDGRELNPVSAFLDALASFGGYAPTETYSKDYDDVERKFFKWRGSLSEEDIERIVPGNMDEEERERCLKKIWSQMYAGPDPD